MSVYTVNDKQYEINIKRDIVPSLELGCVAVGISMFDNLTSDELGAPMPWVDDICTIAMASAYTDLKISSYSMDELITLVRVTNLSDDIHKALASAYGDVGARRVEKNLRAALHAYADKVFNRSKADDFLDKATAFADELMKELKSKLNEAGVGDEVVREIMGALGQGQE